MAKITFGPIVAEARNKQGGIVYSRGRAGPYTRLKVSGVNPRTARQTAVRTLLASAANAWTNTLTGPERDTWNALASTTTLKDKLGHTYQPTGQQLYCGAFANAAPYGGAPPASARPPLHIPNFSLPLIPQFSLAGGFSVGYTCADVTSGQILVYASAPFPASRTYLWRHLKFITVTAAAAASTGDFTSTYLTAWGLPFLGQIIGVRAVPVDQTTGLAGAEQRTIGTVVA